ncbi:hypothetical protein FOZ62_013937, partial [Perkinsus olseni]
VFDDVCTSLGYTVYEKTSTSTTALKDLSLSSPALLKCVSPVWNRSQSMVKNLAVCRCTVKSSHGSADEKSSEGSGEFKMLVFTASDGPSNREVENRLEEKLGGLSHYWMSVMHGAIEENGTGRGADDAYEFFRGVLLGYCRYYSQDDKEFVYRCDRLRGRYTVESLPALCGVREDFIGQAGESSDLQQLYVAGSERLHEVEDAMKAEGGFYPTAMETLLSVAPLLREDAAKASEGRKELIDMDDLMPSALSSAAVGRPSAEEWILPGSSETV